MESAKQGGQDRGSATSTNIRYNYYSGTTNNEHKYGVGIVVSKNVAMCVTNFVPISERLLLLQIEAKPARINIIQVYAPTRDHSEEEVEQFYENIKAVLRKLPKQDVNMVMRDFNAKVRRFRR